MCGVSLDLLLLNTSGFQFNAMVSREQTLGFQPFGLIGSFYGPEYALCQHNLWGWTEYVFRSWVQFCKYQLGQSGWQCYLDYLWLYSSYLFCCSVNYWNSPALLWNCLFLPLILSISASCVLRTIIWCVCFIIIVSSLYNYEVSFFTTNLCHQFHLLFV